MEVIIEYHVWRILKTNNFFFYSYKIKLLLNFISENIKTSLCLCRNYIIHDEKL